MGPFRGLGLSARHLPVAMRENYGGFGSERRTAIYLRGAEGEAPAVPLTPARLEEVAGRFVGPEVADYIAGGAGGDETVRANSAAFARWQIVPRMLRDVHERDTRVELFGTTLPAPLALAPIGGLGAVRPDAELEIARAASELGVPFVAGTLSSHSLEEIAAASGVGPRWFQLYWGPDPELNMSLVGRAEKAGYSVLVITLDTRLLAWRERDLARGYIPFLNGFGLGNYLSDPVFRSRLERPPEEDAVAAARQALGQIGDPAFSWADLRSLCDRARLPVVVKGVLHRQDAVSATEAGANGVIVSNHGGRQVGGSVPSLSALPGIVEEVGRQVPVLFDSGIRRGSDMVKALALGARAVLLGRPYVWGAAVGGEAGVRDVVENLLADFDLTMANVGCARLADLTPELVLPA
jgi:lactate 2-monooxygenase